jgi:GT2 family glycosyltransferase
MIKDKNIKLTVLIPSFDGNRGGNVKKLIEKIESQTLKPSEIITVIGVHPNGKARNVGVGAASGEYYVFIDDDVTLGSDDVLENLIRPFLERNDVGMTGPSQLIPENSNQFQKKAADEIPRSVFPVQKELVDSDMVSHMCLAMPSKLFKDIGMENPDIISGTDPDLRYRVRKVGFRVCVVPNTFAYHPMPESFLKLLKLAFIKGKNSAIVRRTYPELIFELDFGFKKEFAPRKSFLSRIIRACADMTISLLSLKLMRFSNAFVYAIGNFYGTFHSLKKDPR